MKVKDAIQEYGEKDAIKKLKAVKAKILIETNVNNAKKELLKCEKELNDFLNCNFGKLKFVNVTFGYSQYETWKCGNLKGDTDWKD